MRNFVQRQHRCARTAIVFAVLATLLLAGCGSSSTQKTTQPHASAAPQGSTTVQTAPVATNRRTTATQPGHTARPRAAALTTTNPVVVSVYAGGGAVNKLRAANRALKGAVSGAFDYLSDSSWAALSEPSWLTEAWGHTGLHLTLAVPMFARSGDLAACAAGDYDAHFSTLAQTLASGGLGDATLAIGWEPETARYRWSVHNLRQAHMYVACWRRIHNAIASTPGAKFEFLWDPGDPPLKQVALAKLYPGNRYVNIVATSALDTPAAEVPPVWQWPMQARWRYGGDWAAHFAHAHHKPIALFMLGLNAGDNGTYVSQILRWAVHHHVVSMTIWNYRSSGLISGHFPAALEALRRAHADGEIGVRRSGHARR